MTRNKIFILLLSGAFVWGSLANPEGVVNSDSEDRTPQQIKDDVIDNMIVAEGNMAMATTLGTIGGIVFGLGMPVMISAAAQGSTFGIVLSGIALSAGALGGTVMYKGCRSAMRRLHQARTDITNL